MNHKEPNELNSLNESVARLKLSCITNQFSAYGSIIRLGSIKIDSRFE